MGISDSFAPAAAPGPSDWSAAPASSGSAFSDGGPAGASPFSDGGPAGASPFSDGGPAGASPFSDGGPAGASPFSDGGPVTDSLTDGSGVGAAAAATSTFKGDAPVPGITDGFGGMKPRSAGMVMDEEGFRQQFDEWNKSHGSSPFPEIPGRNTNDA